MKNLNYGLLFSVISGIGAIFFIMYISHIYVSLFFILSIILSIGLVLVLFYILWKCFNWIYRRIFGKEEEINRYLKLLKWFSISIILFNISILFIFIYVITTNSDLGHVDYTNTTNNITTTCKLICNVTSNIVVDSRKYITNYKSDIRLWIFAMYFVSSIYLVIKKPLRISNYTTATVNILGLMYLPLMLGVLFFIPATVCGITLLELIPKISLVFLSILSLSILIIPSQLFMLIELGNNYKSITYNYNRVKKFWNELKTVNGIYKESNTLQSFLWSSSVMLLIISLLEPKFVVFYILLLSFILYLHWAVAVFFKPIQKIEKIKIIGETDNEYKLIKNAYLIEETDSEYIIIYKNNDILRIPRDSCILKNVRTP